MRSVLDLEFPSERECFLGFHDSQCVVLDVSSQTLGIFIFFLVSPIQGKKKNPKRKEGVWVEGSQVCCAQSTSHSPRIKLRL